MFAPALHVFHRHTGHNTWEGVCGKGDAQMSEYNVKFHSDVLIDAGFLDVRKHRYPLERM